MSQGEFWISVSIYGRQDETGVFIAGSPELDVWSTGATPQQAALRADEAITLFLDEARDMGTLDRVLTDAGVARHYGRPVMMKQHTVASAAYESFPGFWPFIFQLQTSRATFRTR